MSDGEQCFLGSRWWHSACTTHGCVGTRCVASVHWEIVGCRRSWAVHSHLIFESRQWFMRMGFINLSPEASLKHWSFSHTKDRMHLASKSVIHVGENRLFFKQNFNKNHSCLKLCSREEINYSICWYGVVGKVLCACAGLSNWWTWRLCIKLSFVTF